MLIYCVALAILLCEFWIIASLYLSDKEKNKLYSFVFFIEFFIILAFRDISVLNDTDAYAMHFNRINSEMPFYIIKAKDRFGAGYLIFEQFVHNNVSSSFLVYNIITTTIILVTSVHFLYKRSACVWIALLLFVLNLMFSEIIAVRQGIALSIGLWGYYFLERKKIAIYLIFVVVAYLFHNSAIFLLLLVVIQTKWKSPRWRTFIVICSVIIFYSFAEISTAYWGDAESMYKTTSTRKGWFSLVGVYNTLNALILFCYICYIRTKANKYEKVGTEGDFDDKFHFTIVLVHFIMSVFSIRVFVLQRFCLYLLPYICVYISELYNKMKCDKNANRSTMLYLAFAICSFVYIKTIRPEWIGLLPYKFYE